MQIDISGRQDTSFHQNGPPSDFSADNSHLFKTRKQFVLLRSLFIFSKILLDFDSLQKSDKQLNFWAVDPISATQHTECARLSSPWSQPQYNFQHVIIIRDKNASSYSQKFCLILICYKKYKQLHFWVVDPFVSNSTYWVCKTFLEP